MNELLNRWRHGEVNLLQRRFRLARAQAVKHTIASKILGLAAASSNSGTATSAATSANREGSPSFREDGSTSPASRDGASAELDGKKQGESTAGAPKVGVGSSEAGQVASMGDARGGRAGMDKEAFLRVFPDVQVRKREGITDFAKSVLYACRSRSISWKGSPKCNVLRIGFLSMLMRFSSARTSTAAASLCLTTIRMSILRVLHPRPCAVDFFHFFQRRGLGPSFKMIQR